MNHQPLTPDVPLGLNQMFAETDDLTLTSPKLPEVALLVKLYPLPS